LFLPFILILTFLLLTSYFLFSTWLNPFFAITFPFYIITLFVMTLGQNMGYFPISDDALKLIMIGLAFFWVGCLGGYYITHFEGKNKRRRNYDIEHDYKYLDLPMYIAAFLSLVASTILYSLALLRLGVSAFGTEEVAKVVGTGLLAHVRLMAYPAIMYFSLRFLNRPKFKYILIVVVLLLSYFISTVKYHVIMPVLATLFLIALLRPDKLIKIFVACIVLVSIIFFANYAWFFVSATQTLTFANLQWIAWHMIDYVVGGPIALGIFLDSLPEGLGDFSFSSIFFPTLPDVITSLFAEKPQIAWLVNINENGGMNNTGTLFWCLYFFLGWGGVVLWSIIVGSFTSWLFFFAKKKKNFVRVGLLSHIMAILLLTFFGNYFYLWAPWEWAFWIVITPVIADILHGIRPPRSIEDNALIEGEVMNTFIEKR
jgi:oligosaccharide repeat unit polymerase